MKYLKDSRRELKAVAKSNHRSSIMAESSATKHSSLSSSLSAKYKNVKRVLDLVREEYDTMVADTEKQRVSDQLYASSMEQMQRHIAAAVAKDTCQIVDIFAKMDLNGDGELEKQEIVKAITFRPEVKALIKASPNISVALKPESLAKAMKKMDSDGNMTVSKQEFIMFTLNRIIEGPLADAPVHVKAMGGNEGVMAYAIPSGGSISAQNSVSALGGHGGVGTSGSSVVSGGSAILTGVFEGRSSGSVHSGGNNGNKESRRTAEKAYKEALLLLVREKTVIERQLKTLRVVHARAITRIEDLERRVQKGHAETKRLRAMYKTSQKQVAKVRDDRGITPPIGGEGRNQEKLSAIRRKQKSIGELPTYSGLVQQVFGREPELVEMLLQARADNDIEEISMLVCRCRVFVGFVQALSRCTSYEEVSVAAMDYMPQMFESDRVYTLFPNSESKSTVWAMLRRGGNRVIVAKQHRGVSGQVQHTAQAVMIEDVDCCPTYHKKDELEVRASFATRCMMAVPIFFDPEPEGNNQWNSGSYLEKSMKSVPPVFEPAKGKKHDKPIVAIIEVLNKRIRAGHGLPEKDLEAKAAAAIFDDADLALATIAAKSMGSAIARIHNEEASKRQTTFLSKISSFVPRFFKFVMSESAYFEGTSDDADLTSSNAETVFDVQPPETTLPALQDMCTELLGAATCRIFMCELAQGASSSAVPTAVSKLTAADLLEHRFSEEAGAGRKPRSQSEGQAPRGFATVVAATSDSEEEYVPASIFYVSSRLVISETGARKRLICRESIEFKASAPVGICGIAISTGNPVYVRDAYNNPAWNGNIDQEVKGSGMICCPITNSQKKFLGVCQVAISGDVHLQSLALMAPSKVKGAYTEIDATGTPVYKGRRGVRGSPRDQVVSCAVGAVRSMCSQFATVFDYYRQIVGAHHSSVLRNEDQLLRLFHYWAQSSIGKKAVKKLQRANLALKVNLLASSSNTAKSNDALQTAPGVSLPKSGDTLESVRKDQQITTRVAAEVATEVVVETTKNESTVAGLTSKKEGNENESATTEDALSQETAVSEMTIDEGLPKPSVDEATKAAIEETQKDASPDKKAALSPWQAVYDPSSGHYYYYDSENDPMCHQPTWDKPESFDMEAAQERENSASSGGLSLSEIPHGLALLLAARKIQSVFRAKQARKKMRAKRAEHFANSRPNTPAQASQSKWIEMMDQSSGYPYYYNTETHETSWETPRTVTEKESVVNMVDQGSAVLLNVAEATPEKKAALSPWQAVYDPSSGHYYYYDSENDPMCHQPTWDKPESFDMEAAQERENSASSGGLSLSEIPHGLALLLAARKIQSVFRAKQARKKMRAKRAEHFANSRPNTPAQASQSKWIEMMDQSSGYPYYYNTETHETTWEDPRQTTTAISEIDRMTQQRIEAMSAAVQAAETVESLLEIQGLIPNEPEFQGVLGKAKAMLQTLNRGDSSTL